LIPRAHVTAWRSHAPWPTDAQVEQDLVLSRALVELYRNPSVAQTVAFRGGTALHKLFFTTPGRYSEDIDLVQIAAGAIGPILDAIRTTLDPWLEEPKRKQGQGRVTMIYRFEATTRPIQPTRLRPVHWWVGGLSQSFKVIRGEVRTTLAAVDLLAQQEMTFKLTDSPTSSILAAKFSRFRKIGSVC